MPGPKNPPNNQPTPLPKSLKKMPGVEKLENNLLRFCQKKAFDFVEVRILHGPNEQFCSEQF